MSQRSRLPQAGIILLDGVHVRVDGFSFASYSGHHSPARSPIVFCRRTTPIILPLTLIVLMLVPRVFFGAEVDFAHQIVPVLKKHCAKCHGGTEAKGGFSMNTRELFLESEAVEIGKPGESRLVELITSSDPMEQMPPKGNPRLAGQEVKLLSDWIATGLDWEDGFSFAKSSYEPPLKPRRPVLPPPVDGRDNPVDRILDAYQVERKLPRLEPISDAVFARRVFLDLIGLLPVQQELEGFLDDAASDKRERLVDSLLQRRMEYAEHWLSFWNDLLRNDYSGTGFITGGRKQISSWLYPALVDNTPYDEFVRQLIVPSNEAVGFIQGIRWRGNVSASQRQEIQFAQNVSQAFLGINLKCASCHDSFIDRWKLEETYAFAQIYSQQPLELHRCDKPNGKQAQAGWLFPELGEIDPKAPQRKRLEQLADLLTHRDNGRFTRTVVNRIWHRLMGRGIVHPVDAMHTRPWSEDLLDYLAEYLVDNDYDLKRVMALICNSRAYQSKPPALSEPTAAGYVYRGPVPRRLTAEQFMDVVWQLTGAAPSKIDAPIKRIERTPRAVEKAVSPRGKWVWSYADAARGKPLANETITLRYQFDLKEKPQSGFAVATCDNEFTLFVNGNKTEAGRFMGVGRVDRSLEESGGRYERVSPCRCQSRQFAKSGRPLLRGSHQASEGHVDHWQWTEVELDKFQAERTGEIRRGSRRLEIGRRDRRTTSVGSSNQWGYCPGLRGPASGD